METGNFDLTSVMRYPVWSSLLFIAAMADFAIHLSTFQLQFCVRHLFALKFVSNGFVVAVTKLPVLWTAMEGEGWTQQPCNFAK